MDESYACEYRVVMAISILSCLCIVRFGTFSLCSWLHRKQTEPASHTIDELIWCLTSFALHVPLKFGIPIPHEKCFQQSSLHKTHLITRWNWQKKNTGQHRSSIEDVFLTPFKVERKHELTRGRTIKIISTPTYQYIFFALQEGEGGYEYSTPPPPHYAT